MTSHILLIETKKKEKALFEHALRRTRSDFFLMHAESGRDAIKVLEHVKPDIVFIAAEWPNKSLQLIRQIRELKDCSAIPIYLYTNDLDASVGMRALLNGAAGCLLKTKSEDFLISSLHGIIAT